MHETTTNARRRTDMRVLASILLLVDWKEKKGTDINWQFLACCNLKQGAWLKRSPLYNVLCNGVEGELFQYQLVSAQKRFHMTLMHKQVAEW